MADPKNPDGTRTRSPTTGSAPISRHVHDGDADHDHDDFDDGPLEDNPLWLQDHVTLTSVGIDIGSAGTQVIFSKVELRRHGRGPVQPLLRGQPRDAVPLAGRAHALSERGADRRRARCAPSSTRPTAAPASTPDDIDTGVVILTGEALRRENAQAIAGLLAEQGGDFVCATAGHHMEAMLAAYGSGAARVSSDQGKRILNIDIGGGTTKLALVEKGRVVATAAIHIGGRLQVVDEQRPDHPARSGRPASRRAGRLRLEQGRPRRRRRAGQGRATTWPTRWSPRSGCVRCRAPLAQLYLTEPIAELGRIDGIMVSGGVAEYVYGREERDFGDMGRRLGRALRKRLDAGALPWPLLPAGECIRATALGASEYSVQLSGNTSTITDPGRAAAAAQSAGAAAALRLRGDDRSRQARGGDPRAFHRVRPERRRGRGRAGAALARRAVARAHLRVRAGHRARHAADRSRRGSRSTSCSTATWRRRSARSCARSSTSQSEILAIDGVVLWDFDYIDLGRIRLPSMTVPVTIKSLVFSEDPRLPRGKAHLHDHGTHHHHHGHDHSPPSWR